MQLYYISLQVVLRKDILDPAGCAVETRLQGMGLDAQNVRIGKHITFAIAANSAEAAEDNAHSMAERLLVNAVMEDYTITISTEPQG